MLASRAICAALACGCLLFAEDASAQSDQERAGARAAANQGVTAFEAGNYKDALSFMERAESLVHALPHLLYIARSNEKLGNLVQAREAYLKIGREKIKPTDPDVFRETQATAEQELKALEPRIPTVTVNVEGAPASGLTVTMDGQPFAVGLLGVPAPMNPGQHTFEAKAPGMLPATQQATVAESGKASVTLKMQPSGEPVPTDAASSSTGATSPQSTLGVDAGSRPVPTSVYIGLVATGAFAIGTGVVGAMALGNKSDYDDANDGSDPDAAQDIKDTGSTLNLVTDIFLGAAVVSAGVTAVLYFTRPTVPADQGAALRFTPVVLPTGAALSASGRF